MLKSNDFYQAIGTKIKEARLKKGLNQETIAQGLNLTRNSIINLEKGRHKPSVYQLFELAGMLGVPFFSLIPINESIESTNSKLGDYIFDDGELNPLTATLISNLVTTKY